MKGKSAMSLFQRSRGSLASNDGSMRETASSEPREVNKRLRDFCKAKAEVIVSGETTHALRGFLNPFKGKQDNQ